MECGQHPSPPQQDESLEQGRCRARWVPRVDTGSKVGEERCCCVDRRSESSFGHARDAGVGLSNRTSRFCEVRSWSRKRQSIQSLGSHSFDPRFAVSMCGPLSTRIHVMCLFDTSLSSYIEFVSFLCFNAFLLRCHLFCFFVPFLGLNFFSLPLSLSLFSCLLLLSLCFFLSQPPALSSLPLAPPALSFLPLRASCALTLFFSRLLRSPQFLCFLRSKWFSLE